MPPTIPTPTKQGLISFRGTVAELRALLWYWVQVDSKTTGQIWDYDAVSRLWRRRTARNGR